MSKRANLAAALHTATRGSEGTAARAGAAMAAVTTSPNSGRAPSRLGKKTIAAHFDPAVSKQLKLLGVERDTSTQDLMREALNDLFVKYGKGPIA